MRDNASLRDFWTRFFKTMRYGSAELVPFYVVEQAWSPTGDEDTSLDGLFRGLMGSLFGVDTGPSMTSEQRLKECLDDSFNVSRTPEGDYVIRRRLAACPRCKGGGMVRLSPPIKMPNFIRQADMPMDVSPLQVTMAPCTHIPEGCR